MIAVGYGKLSDLSRKVSRRRHPLEEKQPAAHHADEDDSGDYDPDLDPTCHATTLALQELDNPGIDLVRLRHRSDVVSTGYYLPLKSRHAGLSPPQYFAGIVK